MLRDAILVGSIVGTIVFFIALIFGFLLAKKNQLGEEFLRLNKRAGGGRLQDLTSQNCLRLFSSPSADFNERREVRMKEDIIFYDEIIFEAGHRLKAEKPHFGKFLSKECTSIHGHSFKVR
jgi:hypothetical protein